MDLPGVSIADAGDSSMFSLNTINKAKVLPITTSCETEKNKSSAAAGIHFSFTHFISSLFLSAPPQDLNQLMLGDMTGADALVDEGGEEDVHISDSDSDLVSLASDLDEDDLAEIEEKEKQLKKLPKKKFVAQTATFLSDLISFCYKGSMRQEL